MGAIEDIVVSLAVDAHRRIWSAGKDVSGQTKKSQSVCVAWQNDVIAKFADRFACEVNLNESGPAQRIDLVDMETRTAYELKASPNNVHMEIYRDIFKALVFNERNPSKSLQALVFIAPVQGIARLGKTFPCDVQSIATRLRLRLSIRPIVW